MTQVVLATVPAVGAAIWGSRKPGRWGAAGEAGVSACSLPGGCVDVVWEWVALPSVTLLAICSRSGFRCSHGAVAGTARSDSLYQPGCCPLAPTPCCSSPWAWKLKPRGASKFVFLNWGNRQSPGQQGREEPFPPRHRWSCPGVKTGQRRQGSGLDFPKAPPACLRVPWQPATIVPSDVHTLWRFSVTLGTLDCGPCHTGTQNAVPRLGAPHAEKSPVSSDLSSLWWFPDPRWETAEKVWVGLRQRSGLSGPGSTWSRHHQAGHPRGSQLLF